MWDFAIKSFVVDPYSGVSARIQLGLEVVAVIFLTVSTLIQLVAAARSLRIFNLAAHALQPSRLFQWGHTAILWYAWWIWWMQYQPARQNLGMAASYPVLQDPLAVARPFRTDQVNEAKFLGLLDRAGAVADIAAHYRAIAGLGAFLFVFGLLEAFRFQPRLGLITRTLQVILR
jgi:hypothetical protein